VLLDNAKRLDKLVNGEQSTVDDRSGEPLPTWRGITADIESVLASLDTSNSTFPDEPSGIAAQQTGSISVHLRGQSPWPFDILLMRMVLLRRLHGCWALSAF
jgi:hypothetical protein